MNERGQLGRRTIRLKGYDYSQSGGYFVTIDTFQGECLFGEIEAGEMHLNALGRIVEKSWQAIPEHFPCAEAGPYVVMPNHMHGIILIHDKVGTGTKSIAWARHASPILASPIPPRGALPGSLGAIIGSFKSSVTRRAGRELNSGNIWHRNYYEHIIRSQRDYERIENYIAANPANWAADKENPN